MSRHELMLQRCDRCGAEAKNKVVRDELELLFCQHHFNEHEPSLVAAGFSVESLVPVPA